MSAMKKRYISLVLILLLSVSVAYPQKSPIRLGLKLAPNIGWLNSDVQNYNYDGISGGATVGFICDIFFMNHYAVSTGANFLFTDGKLSFPYKSGADTGTMNRKYNFTYFEIPLMLKMNTKEFGKFSFFAQLGLGTGFRLKCKAVDEFQPQGKESISDKHSLTSQTTLMRESVIIGIGSEYHFDESTSVSLSIGYSNSLNNVLNSNNTVNPDVSEQAMLNYAEISIGVFF
jgi:hypothetical protein